MALLDNIADSRQILDTRVRKLQSQGGRVGGSGWNSRWVTADSDSMKQLGMLESAVRDPSWTASLDREVEARRKSQNASLNEEYRQGSAQSAAKAAETGRAGGSWEAVGRAQQDQRLAAARAQVNQQLSELRAAGVQNLNEMGQQLLDSILKGPDDQAAMSTTTAGKQQDANIQQLVAQNEQQYRGLLANAVSGFLNNTVTPAVQLGFTAADRWNTQNRENYRDYRDTYNGSGPAMNWQQWQSDKPQRSFWGW